MKILTSLIHLEFNSLPFSSENLVSLKREGAKLEQKNIDTCKYCRNNEEVVDFK